MRKADDDAGREENGRENGTNKEEGHLFIWPENVAAAVENLGKGSLNKQLLRSFIELLKHQ